MEHEAFFKYPDYLQGFEELEALKSWQWLVVSSYSSEINRMLRSLKMESGWLWEEYWNKIIKFPAGLAYAENVIKLHQRYAVTTLEALKSYISCWVNENRFTLKYDKESMTVTLTAEKSFYNKECYDRIRDVIPCNMMLVIETVEELG